MQHVWPNFKKQSADYLKYKKNSTILAHIQKNIDLCLVFSVVIFKVFKLSLGD